MTATFVNQPKDWMLKECTPSRIFILETGSTLAENLRSVVSETCFLRSMYDSEVDIPPASSPPLGAPFRKGCSWRWLGRCSSSYVALRMIGFLSPLAMCVAIDVWRPRRHWHMVRSWTGGFFRKFPGSERRSLLHCDGTKFLIWTKFTMFILKNPQVLHTIG
jgi:hypothetical protein